MIPPCLTLSNIRYVSRVKWRNPGKGVSPCRTPRCSSYWKGSPLVPLKYGRQLSFTILLGVKSSVVCERQAHRGRRRQTGILTHNFFSWPNHAVLSSKPYVISSDETYSNGPRQGSSWIPASMVLYLPTRRTAASWHRLKTHSDSDPHLGIYILPINDVNAFAYFHRCVLFRGSLIDGSVKGHYATKDNVCCF